MRINNLFFSTKKKRFFFIKQNRLHFIVTDHKLVIFQQMFTVILEIPEILASTHKSKQICWVPLQTRHV